MSWNPNDLVTDDDLLAYEPLILTQFSRLDWQEKRQKVLEDWLMPTLESHQLPVDRFRTRHIPVTVLGYTSSAFSDLSAAAQTDDGLALATILAGSSDYLYLGFTDQFRGLSLRTPGENFSSGTAVAATVEMWADAWRFVSKLKDATLVAGTGRSFARGGAMTWQLPEGVVRRSVNSEGPLYWCRLNISATPTGAKVGPVSVIRRSRLCAVAALRTLAVIYRSAPTEQDGPWIEKADWYEAEADAAFRRVLPSLGREFDTDDDDVLSAAERDQTVEDVAGQGWTLQRG